MQLIAPVMALAGIAGCSTESTEDVVTRTRAEVWVDDRGGDVDALVDPDTFEVFEVAGETSPRLWEFLREQIQ